MRLVVARCQVDYAGRLTAHLPMATRVLMLKADGSVLVHSDGGSYKPLNWMSPPCSVREGSTEDGGVEWVVTGKDGDTLRILIEDVVHDSSHELGVDPGLRKDGVEKHLQELLAEHPATLADGLSLVRREYPTAIGPVDLMCRDTAGLSVAVEIKRRGEIDGVEQLTRYLDLLNRDPLLTTRGPVRGIFAAQEIRPQARVLAGDRGIACAVVDYDVLRGLDDPSHGSSECRRDVVHRLLPLSGEPRFGRRRFDAMVLDNVELERRVRQNKADVDAIYNMLSVISATQTHHGRSLADVEATVAHLDVRLTARLDGIDTRLDGIDGRLAGMDGRLDGIDGRLAGMDGRLGRLEDGVTEVLRRLPG